MTSSSCGLCGRLSIETLARRAAPLEVAWRMDARVAASLPETEGQAGGIRCHRRPPCRRSLHAGGRMYRRRGGRQAPQCRRQGRRDEAPGRRPAAGGCGAGRKRPDVFEIVQKAWLAGIGLVCAVSAPTTLAVGLAEEAGITLLGFARDGGFNIYSHPQRVTRTAP